MLSSAPFKKGDKVLVSNDGTDWYKAIYYEYLRNNEPYLHKCYYWNQYCRKMWKFCKKR